MLLWITVFRNCVWWIFGVVWSSVLLLTRITNSTVVW